MARYVIGIDVGGTGTDCAVLDERGHLTTGKSFSTPPNFTDGMMASLGIAAAKLDLTTTGLLGATDIFLHSTTVGENAIGDATLAKSALLLTTGFEETLIMSRGGYGRWTGLNHEQLFDMASSSKPDPLIPALLTRGVKERVDSAGQILREPNEEDVEAILASLDDDIESLGICFLWSFLNPANEAKIAKAVEALRPGLFVTASHQLTSTLGEYERASTVALNVKLGPSISRYLADLRSALTTRGFAGSALLMQAHGGAVSLADAQMRPVGLLESGPVGGLVGAQSLAAIAGHRNVIAVDVGGTTFKVSVISEGRIGYQRDPAVLRYHYALPKLDIHSESFAGGSVVWIDPILRAPRIGPRSAGAFPGPVCFGVGGTEVTVTDVDLILGYLNSDFYMEGKAGLDAEAAGRALDEQVANPMGMSRMEAASAVYRLINSEIYNSLHKFTVASGVDARDYVLYSYGGTAGMHLPAVAQELGVKSVVIPGAAGVQGAFGLISSDVVYDDILTRPMAAPADPRGVTEIFAHMTEGLVKRMEAEGFSRGHVHIKRSVDIRYNRQLNLVTTPFDAEGNANEESLARLAADYEQLYERLYGEGTAYRAAGIEFVNFRVRVAAPLRRPKPASEPLGDMDPSAAFVGERQAYFSRTDAMMAAKGYDVTRLAPGNRIEGPAIVWSPITTIVINPGQQLIIDGNRNLIVTWEKA